MKQSLSYIIASFLLLGFFAVGQNTGTLASSVNLSTKRTIPVVNVQKMPDDPFGKPEVQMPPDPLEQIPLNEKPDDPFGTTQKVERPPDPLEHTTIPMIMQSFSEADFTKADVISSFVKDIQDTTPAIKDIAVNEDSVQVSYERQAKILGFVPIRYQLRVEGNAETGQVKIKKPWWLFFTSNDAKIFQLALKDNADTLGELSDIVSMKLQIAMERRSKIIQTLSNILTKISKTEESIVQNIK